MIFTKQPIVLSKTKPVHSIYDIKLISLFNEPIDLNQFQGKKILFVNVASKCGFTHQYKGLQKLYENYEDKLMIIGLPCNQFAFQEPGNSKTINAFCKVNYGVDFIITEKVKVFGFYKHSIYQWLTRKSNNGVYNSRVSWNFQKYLVDETGSLIGLFPTRVKPFDKVIIDQIIA